MRVLRILCAVAALASLPAYAEDCVEPTAPPEPPRGATATREQMIAAQETIKVYNAAVTAFSACVDQNKGNHIRASVAVQQLEGLAERFNAELREFRKRNGG